MKSKVLTAVIISIFYIFFLSVPARADIVYPGKIVNTQYSNSPYPTGSGNQYPITGSADPNGCYGGWNDFVEADGNGTRFTTTNYCGYQSGDPCPGNCTWFVMSDMTNGLGDASKKWAGQTFIPSKGLNGGFETVGAKYKVTSVFINNLKIGMDNNISSGGWVAVSLYKYSGNSSDPRGTLLSNLDAYICGWDIGMGTTAGGFDPATNPERIVNGWYDATMHGCNASGSNWSSQGAVVDSNLRVNFPSYTGDFGVNEKAYIEVRIIGPWWFDDYGKLLVLPLHRFRSIDNATINAYEYGDAYAGGFSSGTGTPNYSSPSGPLLLGSDLSDLSKFTVWADKFPPKTCSVNPSSSSVFYPNPVTATATGNANNSTGDTLKLWVERSNGQLISPAPGTQYTYNNVYYYRLSECNTTTNNCTTSSTVGLPVGSYYFHCDLAADPNKCSGNPFCSGLGELGGTDCSGWVQCSANDAAPFTVSPSPSPTPTPAPPTITSLQVNNINPPPAFSNTLKATGLQSSQEGSSWYNPMLITLNANQGSVPLRSYYIAFYNKNVGSAYTSMIDASGNPISQLQTLLNNDRREGFILRYDDTGRYYVWDPSITNWFEITGDLSGKAICGSAGCTTQIYYRVYPGDPLSTPRNENAARTWTVLIDRNFQNKTLYTAAYVVDNNNLSAFTANYPNP